MIACFSGRLSSYLASALSSSNEDYLSVGDAAHSSSSDVWDCLWGASIPSFSPQVRQPATRNCGPGSR